MRALLLGAEGMAQVDRQDWIRKATDAEEAVFRDQLAQGPRPIDYDKITVDDDGRPYWLVIIADHAPLHVIKNAEAFVRLRRLF